MDTETITGSAGAKEKKPTVNMRCPKCRKEGVFHSIGGNDVGWEILEANPQGGQRLVGHLTIGSRRCPNTSCNAFIFVVLNYDKLVRSFPPEVVDFDATNLPPAIITSLEEAIKCHAAGCYRAAALMVRRVLEEVCEDKQASGDNLKKRIAALSTTVVVPKELLDAADELRLLGNDAAHIEAKTYDAIEAEEVEVALELAKEILKAVYQYTSLVARLKALKKAGNS